MAAFLTLLELLYPPRCPFCGRVTPEGAPCPSCLGEFLELEPPQEALAGMVEGCDRLVAAYPYEGPIRRAILRYKKLGQRGLDEQLAAYLAVALRRQASPCDFDLVTAVPGGRDNIRARGFDAGERIARQTARLLELPFYPIFELRVGPSQKELSRRQRLHAARELRLREDAPPLAGLHVLLVDDVVTTGASMEGCGAALRRAGASLVTAGAVAVTFKK